MELPAIVAFDLDATLWYPEMYMLSGPPFRLGSRRGRPVVVDAAGEEVGLIGDAWRILAELATDPKWESVQIAYVSRTDEPSECSHEAPILLSCRGTAAHCCHVPVILAAALDTPGQQLPAPPGGKLVLLAEWAKQCLQMLKLDNGTSLYDLADHHEIYPGSKRTHFRRIHDRSGIAYRDMLVRPLAAWLPVSKGEAEQSSLCGKPAGRWCRGGPSRPWAELKVPATFCFGSWCSFSMTCIGT
jgi:magnesium-dependent phosphatase 1